MLIYAQKFLYINIKLYFNWINRQSASNEFIYNPDYYLSVIFAGIIFYDYYIDFYSQDFQIIINYIYWTKKDFKIIQILYRSLFNYFFGKILIHKHISAQDKNFIMSFFNINENCDSYKYLDQKENISSNELSIEKTYIPKEKNKSIILSVIIVCSNYEKLIRLINSIYSQKFESFEVIIIYDDDNNKKSFKIIDDYIKKYNNMNLFDNGVKKGTLYSITKGISMAKGEYLMILNQNYFFFSNDVFKNLYEEIIKENFDILEFNLYKILPNNYINLYKCKHYESQFNLTSIKYNLDFNNIDIKNDLLTNKLFKSSYIKNIIKKFKLDKINEINDFYYNNIFSFIIERTSFRFKQTTSVNIYINEDDCEKYKFNNFTEGESKIINETIFYIDFIFENSEDTFKIKEIVLNEFFNVLSIIFNKFTKISQSALRLLNKFINCKYISEYNKSILKFYYHSLIT